MWAESLRWVVRTWHKVFLQINQKLTTKLATRRKLTNWGVDSSISDKFSLFMMNSVTFHENCGIYRWSNWDWFILYKLRPQTEGQQVTKARTSKHCIPKQPKTPCPAAESPVPCLSLACRPCPESFQQFVGMSVHISYLRVYESTCPFIYSYTCVCVCSWK